uniref:Dynein cytoplasmic 1 intermediate chain 1 n=1 Tax=Sinocyclocheilus grahami TaxID=75366 RepID=A0A672QW80_SINGR
MADRSDLKAELERKKQRLAQIREEKKRKEDERKKKESEMLQRAENVSEDSDLDRKRRETEALLQSIGISPEPPLVFYNAKEKKLHLTQQSVVLYEGFP